MTIGFKDTCLHTEMASKDRNFLGFAFQGTAYKYNRLPFGCSLAPCTFSKCVEVALQLLQEGDMRIFFYLDNLIILARHRPAAGHLRAFNIIAL